MASSPSSSLHMLPQTIFKIVSYFLKYEDGIAVEKSVVGTCFPISKKGLFLTCNHVLKYDIPLHRFDIYIEGESETGGKKVFPVASCVENNILHRDDELDIALFSLMSSNVFANPSYHRRFSDNDIPYLPIANSQRLNVGDCVQIAAYPRNASYIVLTQGILSAKNYRSIQGQMTYRCDAAFSHGCSGGPVIQNGEVIGMVQGGVYRSAQSHLLENRASLFIPSHLFVQFFHASNLELDVLEDLQECQPLFT